MPCIVVDRWRNSEGFSAQGAPIPTTVIGALSGNLEHASVTSVWLGNSLNTRVCEGYCDRARPALKTICVVKIRKGAEHARVSSRDYWRCGQSFRVGGGVADLTSSPKRREWQHKGSRWHGRQIQRDESRPWDCGVRRWQAGAKVDSVRSFMKLLIRSENAISLKSVALQTEVAHAVKRLCEDTSTSFLSSIRVVTHIHNAIRL